MIKFYSAPDSVEFREPDLRFIETLVRYAESLYWSSGGGEACIDYRTPEDQEEVTSLAIRFERVHGFMLILDAPSQPVLVSIGDADAIGVTTINVGGVSDSIPLKCFVSRETAWDIIEEFCETGEPSDAITWGRLQELVPGMF